MTAEMAAPTSTIPRTNFSGPQLNELLAAVWLSVFGASFFLLLSGERVRDRPFLWLLDRGCSCEDFLAGGPAISKLRTGGDDPEPTA